MVILLSFRRKNIQLFSKEIKDILIFVFLFFQSSSVTKYIRIAIGDKNDNPPYFDQALYDAEVNEDEDIHHTVITVTAKDKDECMREFACN